MDQILRLDLGLSGGIGTVFPGITERQLRTVDELIGDGAFSEDMPSFRSLNHFHNPLIDPWDNAGLRAFSIFGFPTVRGLSSALWQQNEAQDTSTVFIFPLSLASGGGNWSWRDARQRYLAALTRPRKDDTETEPGRDRAFGELFENLGHLTHLVQDAFVPAHVRNDAHPPGVRPDFYEGWVRETRRDRPGLFTTLLSATPKRPDVAIFTLTGNTRAPVPVARLIDTDTFSPLNAGVLGDENSLLGAAEYTNGNFLSRGTLFRSFTLPRPGALDPGPVIQESPGKFRRYFTKSRDGATIPRFVTEGMLFDSLDAAHVAPMPSAGWMFDDRVHEDYAGALLPRAVGYSAALLDYFFRGKLDVDVFSDDGSTLQLRGTNASEDPLVDGTLKLYADVPTIDPAATLTSVRRELTPLGDPAVRDIAPGQALTSVPFQPQEAERFVAVYQGRLGNEIPVPNADPNLAFPGGVIGKVLGGVRVEEVFADATRWWLRTPRGVFPLPLLVAEFEEVKWGDGRDALVAQAPFGPPDPNGALNRLVVYQIQRSPSSVEPLTDPAGVVQLTKGADVTFPFGAPLATVRYTQTVTYRQLLTKLDARTDSLRWNCAPDVGGFCGYVSGAPRYGPITTETAVTRVLPFEQSFAVGLDLAHHVSLGTMRGPYQWSLQEVGVDAGGRLLGLVVVWPGRLDPQGAEVPVYAANAATGLPEVVGVRGVGPSYEVASRLLWALIDLATAEIVASTGGPLITFASTRDISEDGLDINTGRFQLWVHLMTEFLGGPQAGTQDGGWGPASLARVRPEDGFGFSQLAEVTTQGGIGAVSATGWLRDELMALRDSRTGLRVFDFQLSSGQGPLGDFWYSCYTPDSCVGVRVIGATSGVFARPAHLAEARRARPAPGTERIVFLTTVDAGELESASVLAWEPARSTARVAFTVPRKGFHHALGVATGTTAMLWAMLFDPFEIATFLVPLDGAGAATNLGDEGAFFTLLEPSYLYNVSDLKFYRLALPLQRTALPAKLFELVDNPIGDYHAIRLP